MATELREGPLRVFTLPALQDNYIFVIHHEETQQTIVVDPAEAGPVVEFLDLHQWSLSEIWITHHHHDHVGGVAALRARYHCQVRGSILLEERWPQLITGALKEGARLGLGMFTVEVVGLPGHTLDHLGYYVHSAKDASIDDAAGKNAVSWLFSGDVLFGLGCGRVFEGTHQQMVASLEKIAVLPCSTKVFCTHEYTEKNLDFAMQIARVNEVLLQRAESIKKLRQLSRPTVPLTLHEEKMTNPFLLLLGSSDPVAEFSKLREARNRF